MSEIYIDIIFSKTYNAMPPSLQFMDLWSDGAHFSLYFISSFHLSISSTHCGLATTQDIKDLGQHWIKLWLAAQQHHMHIIAWSSVDLLSLEPGEQVAIKFFIKHHSSKCISIWCLQNGYHSVQASLCELKMLLQKYQIISFDNPFLFFCVTCCDLWCLATIT